MRDHSRVLLLGERATDAPSGVLYTRLNQSAAHISVEPDIAGGMLTLRVLATTLRRSPGGVSIDPRGVPGDLVEKIIAAGARIDRVRGIQLLETPPENAVHLHIGLQPPTPTSIRVVPDSYGAHIVRDPSAEIRIARPAHVLGAIYAAALGAGEAFKELAGVRKERRVDHPHLTWCPVALSPDLSLAPMPAGTLQLDLAIAGCGAVGTAVALILQELDAVGTILLIDRQRFQRENVATYSIGDERNAQGRPWKVNLVGDYLTGYRVQRIHADVETLVQAVDGGRLRWPRLILSGLDSVPARHALQRLWPDRLIDAGTGDTAVGLHDVRADHGPCLMCFLPPRTEESAVVRLAKETGLAIERLGHGDDPLLPEEIENLPASQQDRLRPHVGKPVCGLAGALGLVGVEDGYAPAVSFVAQQAACLAVGRLLALELGVAASANFVEYDALIGPRLDALDDRLASARCYCQVRAPLIAQVRAERRRSSR